MNGCPVRVAYIKKKLRKDCHNQGPITAKCCRFEQGRNKGKRDLEEREDIDNKNQEQMREHIEGKTGKS